MDEPKYEVVRVVIDENTIQALDVWEIIDPVWWTAEFWDGIESYEQSVKHFTDEQRMLLALCLYMSDVKNRGHEWYFMTVFGNHWPNALRGFDLIQAPEPKSNLQNALDKFGDVPSLSDAERQIEIEKRSLDFDACDSRFLELNTQLRIEHIMTKYARANPSRFCFCGNINRIGSSSPSSRNAE